MKKSSSSNGTTTVLGRFLKLGKSKSDVHGSNSNIIKRRALTSSSSPGDELEDEFCLSRIQLRGVEKMVHKANNNMRKDVSRSHSWIYGSVKLPSDLPFGYGYGGGGSGNSGNAFMSGGHPHHHHPQQLSPSQANEYGNGNSSNNNSSSQVIQMIPRCQMLDFCSCSCEFGPEEFNFLTGGTGPGSSNSALLALSGNNPRSNNCQACQNLIVGGGSALGKYFKNGNRKELLYTQEQQGQDSSKKAFGSSVRKLTWKSLKQAVKKRPSLDSLKKPADGIMVNSGTTALSKEFANFSQEDDFLTTSTNYFFPEKKNNGFYASCTDLYQVGGESPHVTASVRVRPKRSRQTWHFPNEFGPTPNYQQDEEIYHSEWDLRQCVPLPYEEWITTSSLNPTVNPLTTDTFDSVTNSVKLSNSGSTNNRGTRPANPNSSSSTTTNMNSNLNNKGGPSTSNNGNGGGTNSDMYSNGGVKRFSILHTDVSAYQLNKSANGTNDEDDEEDGDTSESDDMGESTSSVLTDEAVRIAGQGICMPFSNASTSYGGSNNRLARSNSSSSNKFNSANSVNHKGKGNHPHHLLLASSTTMEADGLWSDTQIAQQQPQPSQSKHTSSSLASRERDQVIMPDKGKIDQDSNIKNLNTFKHTQQQQQTSSGSGLYVKASNGSGTTRLILNDGNGPFDDKERNSNSAHQITKSQRGVSSIGDIASKQDHANRKSTNVFVNGKPAKSRSDGSSDSNSKDKYGALRRRKGRSGPGKNLLRETIYEEESEHLEQDEVYAVKIVVSQTGVTDYVKPILKTRSPYATPSGLGSSSGDDSSLYDDVSNSASIPPTRSPKKVQFNSTQEVVVCGGLSEPDDDEDFEEEDEDEIDTGGREGNEDTGSSESSSTSRQNDSDWVSMDHDPRAQSCSNDDEAERKSGSHYTGRNEMKIVQVVGLSGDRNSREEEEDGGLITNIPETEEEEVAQVSRVKVKKKSPTNKPTPTSTPSSTESSCNEVNNLPHPNNDSKRQQLHQALRQLAEEDSMRKNLKPSIKSPESTQMKLPTTQEEKGFQGKRATQGSAVKSERIPNAPSNSQEQRSSGKVKGT